MREEFKHSTKESYQTRRKKRRTKEQRGMEKAARKQNDNENIPIKN